MNNMTTIRILKTTFKRLVDVYGYNVEFTGYKNKSIYGYTMMDFLLSRACINFAMTDNSSYNDAFDWCKDMRTYKPDELNHAMGRIAGVKGENVGDGGKSKKKDLWTTITISKETATLLDHVIDLYQDCKPARIRWSRQKAITFMSRMKLRYTKKEALI